MTAKTYPNASMAPDGSSYVTLTDGVGNLVNTAANAITIGTSPITGGATTQVLFNLAGKVSSDSGFTYAGAGGTVTVAGLTNSTTRNDTGYGYFQPTTGQTVTLSNTAYHTIIDPAGTLASLTVNMPATPTDGM
ncbi:MAG TPA: hypothetical protein VEP90_16265, partial [Methylomirabilota bacterium]|nr:hypothetical protein [Methylomirabilota bacterium]